MDDLDRRVSKLQNPPITLAQLRNALVDEWNNIPMRTGDALVNSFHRRIRAAAAARGVGDGGEGGGGAHDHPLQLIFITSYWGYLQVNLNNW